MGENKSANGFWKAFGPGLLFAGAAVGVSHLVQSTRAGAVYGLALLVFVVIANFVKYPAFRFGQQYAAATGENLLVAYRRQGKGVLWLFVVITLLTMFTGCAAITLTTAALAKATFHLSQNLSTISLEIWGVILAILFVGEFRALDFLIKLLLAFLSIVTLLATALTLPSIPFTGFGDFWPNNFEPATIIFIAALVGWMPAPLDTAVWQSLWTQAKARVTKHQPTVRESALDFNIGFVVTTILALCFVLMGAGVMFQSGTTFEQGAPAFAVQILGLYEASLGSTIATLVGFAAMSVVFSTTLTAIDAWPRTLAGVALTVEDKGIDVDDHRISHAIRSPYYWVATVVLLAGAYLILTVMMNSFKTLIDIATTISFISAPLLARFNHVAMFGDHVPREKKPGFFLWIWSALGVLIMAAFALYYIWIRFLN